MNPVEITRGDSPVILGMPHTGTHVPPDIFARLTPLGRRTCLLWESISRRRLRRTS